MKDHEKYTTPKLHKDYTVSGDLVVQEEEYKIWDNIDLRNMTISNVLLEPGKKTYSHRHPFNDEIYIFHSGQGHMILKEVTKKGDTVKEIKLDVEAGSIIPVNGKWEHQTFNTGDTRLHFTMIYDTIGKPTGNEENTEGQKKTGD